ncbi:MAG: molybdate ABC transporter substrate-binding protein [Nesterenkonia sp.]|nr:molybdate ABC transporter substrate-binding protein [Nesterenkonia sp.]
MVSTMPITRPAPCVALVLGVPLILTACAEDSGQDSQQETLHVFAAASLHETFSDLAESFESEHPDWAVELNFAGSSDLVAQITEGAPADVIATADEDTMEQLIADGALAGDTQIFAENTLTVVTPKDDPAGVEDLEDLTDDGVDVVLCAPQVPCGKASEALLEAEGLEVSPVSEERQVTDVLGKVSSGQADAGLVYVTDAAGAQDEVNSIDVDQGDEVVNRYPIGVLDRAEDTSIAEAFVEHVRSTEGRSVLEDAGFAVPEEQ